MKALLKAAVARLRRLSGADDAAFLHDDAPLSAIAGHASHLQYLASHGNHEGMRVLEVGSREVTGPSHLRRLFTEADYVGFDYYRGPNVDIAGDAHRLSSYFPPEDRFDIIYSSASFEHFAMPWLVAAEIAKLLKVGGLVFVETHFAFSSHERPWHFFHSTDMGLRVLFPPALGFECIEAGFSNPIVGRFSALADPYLRNKPVSGLYCHAEFLGRKVREVEDFDWKAVAVEDVTGGTRYPPPKASE